MSDNPLTSHPVGLDLQALLYVAGEMAPTEVAAFEARLADDQQAREALAAAVVLLAPLSANLRPDPGYRQQVRRRLSHKLLRERTKPRRSHSLSWILTGTTAASLLLVLVGYRWTRPQADGPVPGSVTPASGNFRLLTLETNVESREAVDFADLTTVDRLIKVRRETERKQTERKLRQPLPDRPRPMDLPSHPTSMM